MNVKRRDFCLLAGSAVASVAVGGACRRMGATVASEGRLHARPRDGVKTSASGQVVLGVASDRDSILQVPANGGESPLPLLVMLHGASQSGEDMFWYLGKTHEEAGIAVLLPNSRGMTWDAIDGGFGADVVLLNRSLDLAFETTAIDPARVSIGGFSDGASYAISLGLINGDLFHSVVAFSPGLVAPGNTQGDPRFYISHGTYDRILPVDSCGRRIAANLRSRGYDVTYREFNGDHEVPEDVAREGLRWVTDR